MAASRRASRAAAATRGGDLLNIGIDACSWSNRRGFGRFTRELLAAMISGYGSEHLFTLLVDGHTASQWELPRGAELLVAATSRQPSQAASARGSRSIADMFRLSRAAARRRFDVFFFPAVYSYFPLLHPVATAVTLHDAIAERHPGLVFPNGRSRLLWAAKIRLALSAADRLLTVSEAARREVALVHRYPLEDIDVVPEGPSATFERAPDPAFVSAVLDRHRLDRSEPLVLYVGGLSPHKNIDGLLRAMALLRDRAWRLVVVGDPEGDGFLACGAELRALCREMGIETRVTFTGFVPDEELHALYHASNLLVLPSLGEGFGLPVIEAMTCGLPVAVSNRGSLPEVIGEAGALFDPTEPTSIAEAIGSVLGDSDLRRRLSEAGRVRSRAFSWRESARRVMGILESIG